MVCLNREELAHVAGIFEEGGLTERDLILDTRQLDDFDEEIEDEGGDLNHCLGEDFQEEAQLHRSELDEIDGIEFHIVLTVRLLPNESFHGDVVVLTKQLQYSKESTQEVQALLLECCLLCVVGFDDIVPLHCFRSDIIKIEIIDGLDMEETCFTILIELDLEIVVDDS